MKKRLKWTKIQKNWEMEWRKKIYYDETTVITSRSEHQRCVQWPFGTNIAFELHYLMPTFPFNRFSIGFTAEITYGAHSLLFPIGQCTPAERTSPCNHLGMNWDQFTNAILRSGLVPFMYSLPGSVED